MYSSRRRADGKIAEPSWRPVTVDDDETRDSNARSRMARGRRARRFLFRKLTAFTEHDQRVDHSSLRNLGAPRRHARQIASDQRLLMERLEELRARGEVADTGRAVAHAGRKLEDTNVRWGRATTS